VTPDGSQRTEEILRRRPTRGLRAVTLLAVHRILGAGTLRRHRSADAACRFRGTPATAARKSCARGTPTVPGSILHRRHTSFRARRTKASHRSLFARPVVRARVPTRRGWGHVVARLCAERRNIYVGYGVARCSRLLEEVCVDRRCRGSPLRFGNWLQGEDERCRGCAPVRDLLTF
jgi:hypothetical protein